MHILVISGTNRSAALSLPLAAYVAEQHRALGASVDLLDLQQALTPDFLLPTAYQEPSPALTAVIDRFLAADGVVFVVPEYNGSFPGVLKLLIDMLPYPAALNLRPCAFVGLAAGRFAAMRAVEQLQNIASYRNSFNYPERVLIADSYNTCDAQGPQDAEIRQRLEQQAQGFQAFVQAIGGQAAQTRT